jgi:hypothetical protein
VEEGIYALAGVVIGGVVTGVFAILLERRRETRDAQAARRIVKAELEAAAKAAADALKVDEWPPGWDSMRWSQSWSTYRPVLAATMADDEYGTLARAYLDMALLQAGLAAGQRSFVPDDKSFIAGAKSRIAEADELLARLS